MMAFYKYIKYGHVVMAFFKCLQGIEVNTRLISINRTMFIIFLRPHVILLNDIWTMQIYVKSILAINWYHV
jgi:hypothetical protein